MKRVDFMKVLCKPNAVKFFLIFIALASVADAICTAYFVAAGEVIEMNGIISGAVMAHPWFASFAVLALNLAIIYFLWHFRNYKKWVSYAILLVFIERAGLMVVHVLGILAI